jgi:ABC-type glycerol-3-phosphate transport system substrate-binding protein
MLKQMMIALGLSSLLLAACGKGEDSKPAEQSAAEVPATPVTQGDETAAEPAAAAEDDDSDVVPTAADFEEEATAEITVENLANELSRLEKEIGE